MPASYPRTDPPRALGPRDAVRVSWRHFFARLRGPVLPTETARAAAAATGIIVLLLFVAVLGFVGYSVDARIARAAQHLSPGVRAFFGVVTLLGTSGYMLVLAAIATVIAILLADRARDWRSRAGFAALATRSVCFFAVIAVSGIVAQATKHLIGRARPSMIDSLGPFHLDGLSWKASLSSFPSGHTITAFAAATALSFFAPRLQIVFFSLALLVGLSRVVIGAHYPTDVLAGLIIGMASAIAVARFFARRKIAFRVVQGHLARRGEGTVRAAIGSLRTPTV